ncbi:MAG: thiamine pyrophosphate-dependent enzyme [Nitrososphaerota archaeon]
MPKEVLATKHPDDELIRADRIPHIWCPGCGIGIVMKCYVEAIKRSGIPPERHVVVSGIGCSSRLPGYMNIDSYHTTHGRAIPFAVGMNIVKPDLEITVIAGDGDLVTIGGNHFIHAIRRNHNFNVVLVNNFTYGMTGGQYGATTPIGSKMSTAPYGMIEYSFNLPLLVASLGAPFVARWTTLHIRQLTDAILKAMKVNGFAFIEVVSPCPTQYGEDNNFPTGMDMMKYFREACVVEHEADLRKVDIDLRPGKPLIVGNFVHIEKPSYNDMDRKLIEIAMKGRKPYG